MEDVSPMIIPESLSSDKAAAAASAASDQSRNYCDDKMRAVLAEFLATAFFVYVGCGSVIAAYQTVGRVDLVGVALAFGLSITTLVFAIAHHSGGHINPIVTIAMLIWGEIELTMAVLYILAQLIGSILGSAFLMRTVETATLSPLLLAVNKVGPNSNIGAVFLMEMVLSFLLVYVIGETAINKRSGAGNNAPIAIGVAVFMAHIVAIPFSGTSINPARSFGPAVVSGHFEDLWLFFVAPIVGGILAALNGYYIFQIKAEPVGHRTSTVEIPTPRF